MGFFKSPSVSTTAPVDTGPSAEEIADQEQAKQKEKALSAMKAQEEKRAALRAQVATEDEDEVITRKKLLGA